MSKEYIEKERALQLLEENAAVEYLKARERMCFHFRDSKGCAACPLLAPHVGCATFEAIAPENVVSIVEKWAREHPERSEE